MPSSISTVRPVGVPSSSIVSEPRRSACVPSSTTVTPLAPPLAHQAGEGRGLLAVEVAFQAVADRLVQHHAGPAGSEHHVHLAGRRGHRSEIDQRLAQRLVDRCFHIGVIEEGSKPSRPP